VIITLALVALAAFAIYRWRTSGFEWSTFAATFAGVHWIWLGLSALVIVSTYYGRALRWQVMVRPLRADSSTWNIFVATAIGFTAIVFFGRAGELVRPYLIAKKEHVTFSSQMAAWLLERVLDLLMVLLIFGVALSRVPQTGLKPGPHLKLLLEAGGTIIIIAGAACLALLVAFRYFSEGTHQRILEAIGFLPPGMRGRIAEVLAAFSEGFGSTRANSFVLLLLAYSLLEWTLIVSCFYCLFRAFPATAQFSLTDMVIFIGFVSLGSAVQIPGIGGGMQVAAIIVLTELFKLKLEVASGLAIAIWLVTFVVIVPFGLILSFVEGVHWRNLTQVSEEAPV
jgi:uncharacterized protein (TIRG00374 family)